MSSALKFGIIAAGEADLYPRFGRVMGWDAAAGHAIVLAAGGRLTTANGQPIDYTAPTRDIPNFIARGKFNC
jgi:3'(2'), 5'-bisphosphate nucleotidase